MFDTVEPMPLIAPRQITMINASMTAYSVAVGPSSDTRNRFALVSRLAMSFHFPHNFTQDSTDCRGTSLADELDRPIDAAAFCSRGRVGESGRMRRSPVLHSTIRGFGVEECPIKTFGLDAQLSVIYGAHGMVFDAWYRIDGG